MPDSTHDMIEPVLADHNLHHPFGSTMKHSRELHSATASLRPPALKGRSPVTVRPTSDVGREYLPDLFRVFLGLQQSHGNAFVQRMMTSSRSAPTLHRIHRTIGDGHDLTSELFAGDLKLEACFDNEARLGEGARGPSVTKVQQALLEQGFDLGPAGADGIYGPATAAAVRKFKADEHLGSEQFGDVGPGTMKRLNELFAPAEEPQAVEDGGNGACPSGDEIESAMERKPEIRSALIGADVGAAENDGAPTAIAAPSKRRPTIEEAVAIFKTKMNVSNASDSDNVSRRGQFFWLIQVTNAISRLLTGMSSDPSAIPFVTKARAVMLRISDDKDISKQLAELAAIAAKSKSSEKANMLLLLRPPARGPSATESLLWAAVNKTDQVPLLDAVTTLPTMKMVRQWDLQSCGFHAHMIAQRLHKKGGIVPLDPKAKGFSSQLASGGAVRDRRPMGVPMSAFGAGATAGVTPGSPLQLGDVIFQSGVGSAVTAMIAALDAGQILHARVLSGIGYGLGGPSPSLKAKPQRLSEAPPEEHSILIIGTTGNETFVFHDPDASVSKNPEPGFGMLFFDPVDGRLSTSPAPGAMPVSDEGKHRSGNKRYQVISVATI